MTKQANNGTVASKVFRSAHCWEEAHEAIVQDRSCVRSNVGETKTCLVAGVRYSAARAIVSVDAFGSNMYSRVPGMCKTGKGVVIFGLN